MKETAQRRISTTEKYNVQFFFYILRKKYKRMFVTFYSQYNGDMDWIWIHSRFKCAGQISWVYK